MDYCNVAVYILFWSSVDPQDPQMMTAMVVVVTMIAVMVAVLVAVVAVVAPCTHMMPRWCQTVNWSVHCRRHL